MKKIIYFIILSIAFVSCKSKSNIITSKEVAIEKGIYEYDAKKNIAIAKKALKVKKEQLKKEKTLAKALKKQEDFSKEIVKKKKLLEKKLAKLISLSDFPSPYDLVILKNGKHPKDGFFSSSHLDILSQNRYAISFENYKGYILNKILPQLFFSIFLFSVILLSFFIMWQNLEKQRRLTELKNDFISNITHELKTPIGALSLLSEAVLGAKNDPEAVEKFANRMQTESKRLTDLVQEIINLSRLQDSDPLSVPSELHVQDLIREAIDQTQVTADSRQIVVSNSSDVDGLILGDREQLIMAIQN